MTARVTTCAADYTVRPTGGADNLLLLSRAVHSAPPINHEPQTWHGDDTYFIQKVNSIKVNWIKFPITEPLISEVSNTKSDICQLTSVLKSKSDEKS